MVEVIKVMLSSPQLESLSLPVPKPSRLNSNSVLMKPALYDLYFLYLIPFPFPQQVLGHGVILRSFSRLYGYKLIGEEPE